MREVQPPPGSAVDHLLETSFGRRGRRLPGRELRVEACLTAVFLLLAGALAVLAPGTAQADAGVLLAVPAYVLASRACFPLGAGYVVPTEPLLVAFFGLASPELVPLLVLTALVLARMVDAVSRREHAERLVFCGGDAMHALGPAAVLVAAGGLDGLTPLVVAAAFAAQAGVDLVTSVLREWWGLGVRPRLQARVVGIVLAVDLALLPLGLLAVHATSHHTLATLAFVPLVVLTGRWARHRERGAEEAHARLVALERERERLRLAVRRIGEALASNLDLDALLQVVARAAADALDATAGQAGTFAGDGRAVVRRAAVGDAGAAAGLLAATEAGALAGAEPCQVLDGAWAAVGCRIASGDALAGVVVVAREGAPFEAAERELLAYLCEQAGVAAGNVLRHEVLHRQALTDELTGLANHRRFQEILTASIERHRRTGAPASVVLVDIDDFKRVNDVHGHHVGDEVLRAIGGAMRTACRASDEPARYGGEELAVVLPEGSPRTAAECAERIRHAVEELEVVVRGERLRVTASLGVATLGGPLGTRAALLAAADNALYRAKAAGKNRVETAAPGRRGALVPAAARAQRSAAEADLRRALDAGELFLEFQPIVDLAAGETTAVEALVRWRHPRRGVLRPAEFVPLAERRGLIVPLGEWVLREATRQAAIWADRRPGLGVHVNVSLPQLYEHDFGHQVASALATSGLPAPNLVVELAESVLARDADRTAARLAGLRELGVRVAVDDFGTGHSSLQNLLCLPLDLVKVPIAFTEGIDGGGARHTLARGILDLAHGQGLAVVAEGVERVGQLRALEAAGCVLGQGFLFGAGVAPDVLARRLDEPILAVA